MSADLCHQEHFFAATVPERSAQDGLSFAVVIFPGVVEKSNAGVDRLVNELYRLVQRIHISEMMTTNSNSRNARILASEFSINHVARLPHRRCRRSPRRYRVEAPRSNLPRRWMWRPRHPRRL